MKNIFFAIMVIALSGQLAHSQQCRVRQVNQFVQPVHQQQFKQVVQQVHHQQQFQQEIILVPKALQVAVSPDYYYSISDGYREALLADAIAQRIVAAAQQQLRQAELPQERTQPSVPQQQPSKEAPKSMPMSQSLKREQFETVIANSCVKCHTAKNGVDLALLDAVPYEKRWQSYALVNIGEMPQGGKALPDDQLELFLDWARGKLDLTEKSTGYKYEGRIEPETAMRRKKLTLRQELLK